jgi:hypothetical protein
MRGKNKSRRLKLKRSKSHSLKLRKRRKTKKKGGAGSYKPGLKTVSEENPSGVKKRPISKTRRKPAKTVAQVPPSSTPASTGEYTQHKKFMQTVEKAKKLNSPVVAEMEDYEHFNTMAWL